jgi:hypothetical protein
VTSLPTWAVYSLGFGTPVLAFAGGLVSQLITRRGAVELDKRSKREEVMRVLRWAAELGVAADEGKARLGRAQLETLLDSELLDEKERDFVQVALEATLARAVEQIEQAGEGAQAIVIIDAAGATDTLDVSSKEEARAEREEGDS